MAINIWLYASFEQREVPNCWHKSCKTYFALRPEPLDLFSSSFFAYLTRMHSLYGAPPRISGSSFMSRPQPFDQYMSESEFPRPERDDVLSHHIIVRHQKIMPNEKEQEIITNLVARTKSALENIVAADSMNPLVGVVQWFQPSFRYLENRGGSRSWFFQERYDADKEERRRHCRHVQGTT